MSEFELVTLKNGEWSVRSLEHDETFHPVIGPITEARELHVAQHRLAQRVSAEKKLVIWDVGLGAAANAIAAIEELLRLKPKDGSEIHSFDSTRAPLEFALKNADQLGYIAPWKSVIEQLLEQGTAHFENIAWHFHGGDFCEMITAPSAPMPDAILYDPYSPASNPLMWSLEHFLRLRKSLGEAHCTLSSYSRSTSVRVTFLLAGFAVGRGVATGEKEETTIAATDPELLADPLDEGWLERVGRSTKGSPLRLSRESGPIDAVDFTKLREAIGRQ